LETSVRKETYGDSNDLEAAFFAGHSSAVWNGGSVCRGSDWFTQLLLNYLSYLPRWAGTVSTYLPLEEGRVKGVIGCLWGCINLDLSASSSYTFATRKRPSGAVNTSAQILLKLFR
jgi:hypothetical protein